MVHTFLAFAQCMIRFKKRKLRIFYFTKEDHQKILMDLIFLINPSECILALEVGSLNQPHWADSVIELQCPSVCGSVCLFVCAIGCSFFTSLSLALRSHDQLPGLSLVLPPSLPHSLPPSLGTWKLGNLETPPKI